MAQLKPLSHEAVPAALEKAWRYRLLNEPAEAESICLDVLAVDPQNQQALVTLVLAYTDQFAERHGDAVQHARELLSRLTAEYDREYYAGIICERRAKAHLGHHLPGSPQAARGWLKQALDHYARAEVLRAAGNDDAILRWNACQRLLDRHPEVAGADDPDTHLLMLE